MNNFKIIIVEDVPLELKGTEGIIKNDIPEAEIIGTAENEPAYDANNIELCDACNYTFSKNGIHYDKKNNPRCPRCLSPVHISDNINSFYRAKCRKIRKDDIKIINNGQAQRTIVDGFYSFMENVGMLER